jgi:hypothetical protein
MNWIRLLNFQEIVDCEFVNRDSFYSREERTFASLNQPHLVVADFSGMEIDLGEWLGSEREQSGFGKAFFLGVELEAIKMSRTAHAKAWI